MDVTEFLLKASGKAERHDEENLLVQMQDRWELPRKPSKSVQDMELKSLKKKYKSKGFAAGCSREVIEQGAEMLGWPRPEVRFRH
jgi:hypothetical protein